MQRMATRLSVLLVAWVMFTGAAVASAAPISFEFLTVPAGGSIEGEAGSTIGWGYTLSNPSATDWLVTTDLGADSFFNGTATVLFDLPMLAPGASITVQYDASNGLGLYELTWDATAPVGFLNQGIFIVHAEWWDGDPFDGGNFIDAAPDAMAAYSASVMASAPPTNPVPEPSTLLLLGGGLSALRLRKRRSPQDSRTRSADTVSRG